MQAIRQTMRRCSDFFENGVGVGIILYSSINQFAWREVGIMLISILVVVIISEFISATIRKWIS